MSVKSGALGDLVKSIRSQRGWTLREMSKEVEIPLSTLAKIETNKLSLTYDKLQHLASRLGMSLGDFLGLASQKEEDSSPVIMGRRSVTGDANTIEVSTRNYEYKYLCSDIAAKKLVPIIVEVKSKSIEDFGDFISHSGEEFFYVLEGAIQVHLQLYTPITLNAGQGMYIDSSMKHAFIAKDCERALALSICSDIDITKIQS